MKFTGDTLEVLKRMSEQEKEITYYNALIGVIRGLFKWVNLPWCYADTDSVKYTKLHSASLYGKTVTEMEEKKMTNGEKMKEVFGANDVLRQCVSGLINPGFDCTGMKCDECAYWSENWFKAEYKAPKKVRQRRAKFFASLDELLSYVHEHEISESDVINVTKSEGLSSVNWCLTYNQYLHEKENKE